MLKLEDLKTPGRESGLDDASNCGADNARANRFSGLLPGHTSRVEQHDLSRRDFTNPRVEKDMLGLIHRRQV